MQGSSDSNSAPEAALHTSSSVSTDAPTSRTTPVGKAREIHGAQGNDEPAPSDRKRVRKDEARPVSPKRARLTLVPIPQQQPPTSAIRSTLQRSVRAQDGRTLPAQAGPQPAIPQQPPLASDSRARVPVSVHGRAAAVRFAHVPIPPPPPPPVWAGPPPPTPALPISRVQFAAYAALRGPRCPVPGCGAPAGFVHLETHLVPEMNVCGLCGLAYPSEIEVTLHISAAHRWTIMGHDVLMSQ